MSVDAGAGNIGSTTTTATTGSGGSQSDGTQGGAKSQTPTGTSHPSSSTTSSSPSIPETYEVRVNGKTVKMSKDEVIGYASKGHAADSRFEEASRIRKDVDRIIHTAKSNPIDALMDPSLGLSKDQIRDAFEKWYTQEYIEPETLTPEQKRAKEMERELQKYRAQEKESKEKAEREEQDQLTSKQREYLQGQIIEAMEKSGLPKTKFFAQRMAFYMRENLRQGWDAPIELIANQVKKERQEFISDMIGSADVQALVDMFGEAGINKIRRHDLEQLRSKRQFPNQQVQKQSDDGYGNSSQKLSSSDVNKRLRDLRLGKK